MLNKKTVHKHITNTRIAVATLLLLGSSLLGGCAKKYKSSWSCKNPEGIGCSSIFYADQIARKHIILNDGQEERSSMSGAKGTKSKHKKKSKVLIKEHYSDFEKVGRREVEVD